MLVLFVFLFGMKMLVILPHHLSLHRACVVCRAACLCLRHSLPSQASHPASRACLQASPPSPSWPTTTTTTTTHLYQQPSATVGKVRETEYSIEPIPFEKYHESSEITQNWVIIELRSTLSFFFFKVMCTKYSKMIPIAHRFYRQNLYSNEELNYLGMKVDFLHTC